MNCKAVEIGRQNRERIKEFVLRYYESHGELPTYEEIKEAVGLSKSNIYEHLKRLQKEGELDVKVKAMKWSKTREIISNAKKENIEKARTIILTQGRRLYYFCVHLLEKGVKEISLFDLSTEFLSKYENDATTTIKQLYDAANAVGIKVTDCAWSR